MIHHGIATLLAYGMIVPAAGAVCAERDSVVASLARQFKEAPREVGLASNGMIMELTTTGDGRTWTLLMTRPDGTTCVVAAGEAWERSPQEAAGQPM
jgi:hypothetical protein